MKLAYVALTAQRPQKLDRALALLAEAGNRVLRVSLPVVEVETDLFPRQWAGRLRQIATKAGVNIEVVLYGNAIIDCAALTVPHPKLHRSRRLLAPMTELAPELRHPVLRKTMHELLGLAGRRETPDS